jgi:hypothetical protein
MTKRMVADITTESICGQTKCLNVLAFSEKQFGDDPTTNHVVAINSLISQIPMSIWLYVDGEIVVASVGKQRVPVRHLSSQ